MSKEIGLVTATLQTTVHPTASLSIVAGYEQEVLCHLFVFHVTQRRSNTTMLLNWFIIHFLVLPSAGYVTTKQLCSLALLAFVSCAAPSGLKFKLQLLSLQK